MDAFERGTESRVQHLQLVRALSGQKTPRASVYTICQLAAD